MRLAALTKKPRPKPGRRALSQALRACGAWVRLAGAAAALGLCACSAALAQAASERGRVIPPGGAAVAHGSDAVIAGNAQVVEYYDAHDDLYFITSSLAEAALIDSGADNSGPSTWSRTGYSFSAYASPGPGEDVCRFYDPAIAPVGVHFYTALAAECASVRANLPQWNFELGNVFNIPLPVGGACASGLVPVIRYFDRRVDESWRYITDASVDAAMLAKGWENEGVQMCAAPPPAGTAAPNVAALSVDPGPANAINMAFVSVTICEPNTVPANSNCQTIDHVQVNTGFAGLRILASTLPPSFALPLQTDASGNPILECAEFPGAFSWGSIRTANVQIAGEQAASLPIQLIGDPAFPAIPGVCSSYGLEADTVADFLANGLLGVGPSLQDCGGFCASNASADIYFSCPASGCRSVAMEQAQQLPNPVALLGTDNNGVLVELPAVPAGGAVSLAGSLIFGVGTQSNNALGSAQVYSVDTGLGGVFTTTYKGQMLPQSTIDLGDALNFFDDFTIARCLSFELGLYCPPSTLNLSAVNVGTNGVQGVVDFSVADAESVLSDNPSADAFDNLAAPGFIGSFEWGLPFFLGRSVFVGLEGKSTPGGNGPYFAY